MTITSWPEATASSAARNGSAPAPDGGLLQGVGVAQRTEVAGDPLGPVPVLAGVADQEVDNIAHLRWDHTARLLWDRSAVAHHLTRQSPRACPPCLGPMPPRALPCATGVPRRPVRAGRARRLRRVPRSLRAASPPHRLLTDPSSSCALPCHVDAACGRRTRAASSASGCPLSAWFVPGHATPTAPASTRSRCRLPRDVSPRHDPAGDDRAASARRLDWRRLRTCGVIATHGLAGRTTARRLPDGDGVRARSPRRGSAAELAWWSWRESNPRPPSGHRSRYDRSRGRGCAATTSPGRVAIARRRPTVPPELSPGSAVFPAASGLSRRHPPLLVPGCGGVAPRAIAGRSVSYVT